MNRALEMTVSSVRSASRLARVTFLLSGTLLLAATVAAQFGGGGGQTPAARVNQLPLSGQAAQSGSVTPVQAPVPGTTTSVNTLNPSIQVQGAFTGSALSTVKMPFSGKLSLNEAIQRAMQYNLGSIGLTDASRQARGLRNEVRSSLLPNLNGNITETVETLNLRASGIRINVPGFSFPTIVGPFNFIDFRASLSQTLADATAWNNLRSANDLLRASEHSARDARDLVVLATGGAYLQVIAARARVDAARAQLETANALFRQAADQKKVGLVAQIDVNHSEVQALTQQQRLITLQNDLAKQKINLARITGLPPTDQYEITDDVPFTAAPAITIEEALRQAFDQRADLKASEEQVRAAEHARGAARSERLPSVSLDANYGAIGTNPAQAHGTYAVSGTVRIPIWQGGRVEADVMQADAVLTQHRAELEDIKSRVESEVRNAYLDLQSTSNQVDVALRNVQVTQENLVLTRQRFEAGVSSTVEVVQAQEAVATAQLDYINSVFAHNLAKLARARAIGRAADNLPQFLKVK